MNKKFNKIVIGIAIIALAITPMVYFVYFVGIGAIWTVVAVWEAEVYIVITAIASVVIACLALWANIREGKETRIEREENRKHNRLSVRPLLRLDAACEEIDGLFHYKLKLVNRGIGPAIIKDFVLISDGGKEFHDNFEDYNKTLHKMLKGFDEPKTTHLDGGSVIAKGEMQILWQLKYDPKSQNINAINELGMIITYQSIYKDEIITLHHRLEPQPISPLASAVMSAIPKRMAEIHAACFTIPRPWTAQEFSDVLEKTPELCLTQHVIPNPISPVCGFVIGQKLNDTEIKMITLAIAPEQQGKGRGLALLNNFIADVKKIGGKSIFLEVAQNNAPALHIFEKAGFKKIELHPAYYEVPDAPNLDMILMRFDISDT